MDAGTLPVAWSTFCSCILGDERVLVAVEGRQGVADDGFGVGGGRGL